MQTIEEFKSIILLFGETWIIHLIVSSMLVIWALSFKFVKIGAIRKLSRLLFGRIAGQHPEENDKRPAGNLLHKSFRIFTGYPSECSGCMH